MEASPLLPLGKALEGENALPTRPVDRRGVLTAKIIGWGSFLFLLLTLLVVGLKSDGGASLGKASSSAELMDKTYLISIVGEYARPQSLIDGYYPWKEVVEPYHTTTLVASGLKEHHSATWTITCLGDDCAEDPVVIDGGSNPATHIFTAPTQKYEVKLEVVEKEDGALVKTVTKEAICKYVRREFREMKPQHTKNFFAALEVIYRNTDLEAGKAAYGSRFVNSKVLTAKHNDDTHCYHNGRMFFTAHGAFDLLLDNALQSVDPSVTLP